MAINLFSQLPRLFLNQSENSVLKIEKDNGTYAFSIQEPASPIKTIESIQCLKEIIGIERLNRISKKTELALDGNKIQHNQLILTKDVIRKIFIGLMDVQKVDWDEIPGSLNDKINKLYCFNNLQQVEDILMGMSPCIENFKIDKAHTSGKGLKGLTERVYLSIHHHFKVLEECNQKAAELRDIEMLTSRYSDREIREGSLVHLQDGYFFAEKTFAQGGAYITLLRDVENLKAPKIVCRGTAMRRTANGALQSGINNILLEIGTMGIKRLWPQLASYLKQQKITSIEILGKSLGGAHAQHLAVLMEGVLAVKVEKLSTYCSVGVGKSINRLFVKEVANRRKTPLKIQIIRNGSSVPDEIDHIPTVGGVHLGKGCEVEVCYVNEGSRESILPKNMNILLLLRNFFRSFKTAHCRQTTLDKFTWKILNGKPQVFEHLQMGNQLEKIRKCVAWMIRIFTLSLLNGPSFTSFFYREKRKISEI